MYDSFRKVQVNGHVAHYIAPFVVAFFFFKLSTMSGYASAVCARLFKIYIYFSLMVIFVFFNQTHLRFSSV